MPRKKTNISGTELDKRRKYTDHEKLEVALQYIMCGTAKGASERVKAINPRFKTLTHMTVLNWLKTESFQEMVTQVEDQYERRIRGRMNQIIDKAQEVTLERLEKGNMVLNKSGELTAVPVNAKDSMVIGAVAYDKRRLSLGMASSISSNVGNKALESLAKQFEEIAEQSKMRTIRRNESINGEYEEITPPESAQNRRSQEG